ncbi:PilX N-terminal domain-containing pilus assembly protein [Luteimonas sp. RD2P54]|uniref:PilX N-terminal domain-containing pilus assembly protein n=1 Tax=Luteimonas endophytica TaxID=3042023 RepID=A0ABT6JAH3_9GAMM|nr:PilX N-terminal domain-containing pilus assembly protein [Luteimonas endophytica]MDH5823826.1 PilX N-terminal domain-containing pilus assembly protein [Luteimonas endophytica]
MAKLNLQPTPSSMERQRGAVLYVALIMLVLLAMIGIVALQVAGMQERMSANYYATNVAFQNAEALARNVECNIEDFDNRTDPASCPSVVVETDIERNCDLPFDVQDWLAAQALTTAPVSNIRKIDECIVGESPIPLGVGPVGDVTPISIYQITAYDVDSSTNRTSAAAVDTVFKL